MRRIRERERERNEKKDHPDQWLMKQDLFSKLSEEEKQFVRNILTFKGASINLSADDIAQEFEDNIETELTTLYAEGEQEEIGAWDEFDDMLKKWLRIIQNEKTTSNMLTSPVVVKHKVANAFSKLNTRIKTVLESSAAEKQASIEAGEIERQEQIKTNIQSHITTKYGHSFSLAPLDAGQITANIWKEVQAHITGATRELCREVVKQWMTQ